MALAGTWVNMKVPMVFAGLATLCLATTANLPIRVEGTLCHPRRLMVKYEQGFGPKALESAGFHVLRDIPEIRYAVVETGYGELLQTRSALRRSSGVQAVYLDRAALPAYTPNDPMWPQLHSQQLKLDLAWDITKGNSSVVVAVLDTGVNTAHEDLAANIYVNPGEIPGNGIDDDGNGYVDDVKGWDFDANDPIPNDVQGHGSACAGLVAAVQDNSKGVTGAAPLCKILPLKVANDSGYFFDSVTTPAYIYAANLGARVYSMSYFSDRVSQPEHDGLIYAFNHGVLPVAAAGNANTVLVYYPGAYDEVLSVAALDTSQNKASFSNWGSWVDVAAPGTSLETTTSSGGYTTGFGGTSGACPQVAGVAALCFSQSLLATPQTVRNAIEDTAVLQTQAPFGEFSNYGRVDAQAAVLRMTGGSAPAKPVVVRYISMFDGVTRGGISRPQPRIQGRGFLSATMGITVGGIPATIRKITRDYIDFNTPGNAGPVTVTANGTIVTTIANPGLAFPGYPLNEAATQGATLTGGFNETLKVDGVTMNVTRRSDGSILVQGTMHKVLSFATAKLLITRQFTGTTVGTETLQLYDWSSASYPYGSWVTINSGPVPTSMTSNTYTVPNLPNFRDDEGTILFQLTTSTDLPTGAQLKLDRVALSH